MKLLREIIRRTILQESQVSQKQQWKEVSRIITRVLEGIKQGSIVYSRLDRHSAEIFNDGPNPPHMEKGDEYGNPPMVWIRKGDMGDPFDQKAQLKGTTVLEVGSDLYGNPSDAHAALEIQGIIDNRGQELFDLLTKLVEELQ